VANLKGEDASMSSQLLTAEDRENYGDDLIGMTQRAAREVMTPEISALRAQNAHLQQVAHRMQRAEIERVLDQKVPGWQETYSDPGFSEWLSRADDYSGATRSQLLRQAVAAGDSGRVAAIYGGFAREAGYRAPQRAAQSRSAASGKPIYTRPQIAEFYKQRRLGRISDAEWARREADIVRAGAEGRVVGALSMTDGTPVSRLAR
jgi:hypothetical protein